MTNIVVRKVKDSNQNPVSAGDQVRLGMIEAGEWLANYLKDSSKKKKDVVEHLYKDLVEGSSKGVHEMCIIDRDLSPTTQVLTPKQINKYEKFKYDNGNKTVKFLVHIDDKDEENNIKMNIAVPESHDDLLDGGYVDKVVGQIEVLHQGGDTTKELKNKAEIEKYLLANIFLTRCR